MPFLSLQILDSLLEILRAGLAPRGVGVARQRVLRLRLRLVQDAQIGPGRRVILVQLDRADVSLQPGLAIKKPTQKNPPKKIHPKKPKKST